MPVSKPLGNGLIVNYLCDAGDSYTYLQVYQLPASGLTFGADTTHLASAVTHAVPSSLSDFWAINVF